MKDFLTDAEMDALFQQETAQQGARPQTSGAGLPDFVSDSEAEAFFGEGESAIPQSFFSNLANEYKTKTSTTAFVLPTAVGRGEEAGVLDRATEALAAPFPSRVGEGKDRNPVTGGAEAGLRSLGNLLPSMGRFGIAVAQAGLNPIDTLRGLGQIIVGGAGKLGRVLGTGFQEGDPLTEEEEVFNAVAGALKNRYGSIDAAEKTFTEDPFGAGADIVGILSGTAGGRLLLGKLSTVSGATRASEAVSAAGAATRTAAREAVTAIPGRAKAVVTGVPAKTGEARLLDDVVEIAREPITKAVEREAAKQGRLSTEGRLGEVRIAPTRREQLIADAIEPLAREGRISMGNLPFENATEISKEVSRINQGVKQFVFENKVPVNRNQLRARLETAKAGNEIIFTTDKTLEATYNKLIESFMQSVKKGDTSGIFDARQAFDNQPAVKKLLESERPGENLRRQAVLDVRRAANDYISDLLPANNPFKSSLKQESYMIEAIENLAEKSTGLTGTNAITRFLKDHPTIQKAAGPFILGGLAF